MSFEKKIQEMGLELPPLPKPVANYVPGLEVEGFLYISGQGPRDSNGKFIQGIVGDNLTVEEAYQHARQTALFLLSVAKYQLGSLDYIQQIGMDSSQVRPIATEGESKGDVMVAMMRNKIMSDGKSNIRRIEYYEDSQRNIDDVLSKICDNEAINDIKTNEGKITIFNPYNELYWEKAN